MSKSRLQRYREVEFLQHVMFDQPTGKYTPHKHNAHKFTVGVTAFLAQHPEEEDPFVVVIRTFASCCPRDQFNRKIGRAIVEGRARKAIDLLMYDKANTHLLDREGGVAIDLVESIFVDVPEIDATVTTSKDTNFEGWADSPGGMVFVENTDIREADFADFHEDGRVKRCESGLIAALQNFKDYEPYYIP